MASSLQLNASADVGGRFSGPDIGDWSPGTPAFWNLVILAVLVVVILGVAHSVR